MMRPKNLKTRIFLDGGDPGETTNIIKAMGFLDGQTTNPTFMIPARSNPSPTRKLMEKRPGRRSISNMSLLIKVWSHLPGTGPN